MKPNVGLQGAAISRSPDSYRWFSHRSNLVRRARARRSLRFCAKFTALTFALFGSATTAFSDDELPKRQNFNRYQGMLDHSPFAVATAVAAPITTPDAFKGLYVSNAAHMPGEDIVTVMSSDDKNFKEYLSTKQPNEHGYSVSSIEWSDRPGGTKVTISKDGKFGTLNFNQSLIASPLPNVPGPIPPQTTPLNSGIPKPPVRPLPNTTPHTRGVIPRNPNAGAPQAPIPEE